MVFVITGAFSSIFSRRSISAIRRLNLASGDSPCPPTSGEAGESVTLWLSEVWPWSISLMLSTTAHLLVFILPPLSVQPGRGVRYILPTILGPVNRSLGPLQAIHNGLKKLLVRF